jgi:hypothetical protein
MKKKAKEKSENYLIKIIPSFLFTKINNWENDKGLDKDNIPTQEATDYCVDLMKGFIDELKEKVDGSIGKKILISYNTEDFHELSELKNTFKSNHWEDLKVYILLKTKILGEELNSIFLSMSDYGFYASYPDNEEKIITQGYDGGEYDTGYFAVTIGNWDGDAEQYVSKENDSPYTISTKEYNKVTKMLLK